MNKTPEELFALALDGDQTAWRALYDLFSKQVFLFILKNIGNLAIAEDITQEVFLKMYRSGRQFRYGSLKTWVFKICRTTLIDNYRKKSPEEPRSQEAFANVTSDTLVEEEVLTKLETRERLSLLDTCIDKLDFDDKIVLLLVYLANLTVAETSEILETPLGTTKTRLRRARIKLDELLSLETQKNEFERKK